MRGVKKCSGNEGKIIRDEKQKEREIETSLKDVWVIHTHTCAIP